MPPAVQELTPDPTARRGLKDDKAGRYERILARANEIAQTCHGTNWELLPSWLKNMYWADAEQDVLND